MWSSDPAFQDNNAAYLVRRQLSGLKGAEDGEQTGSLAEYKEMREIKP